MDVRFHFLISLCLCFHHFIQANETILRVTEKQIVVQDKSASVFTITQPDGTFGLYLKKENPFEVRLENQLKFPTSVHWHGLILPNNQDGVVFITQFPIYPKLAYSYKFPLIQETKLHPIAPLLKRDIDKRLTVELSENMQEYIWTINGQSWPEVTPLVVEKGQRVEITFVNSSTMSHPMHLHGHTFQVTAINGKPIDGALRDTVLVMPKSSLSIQFDADNPGVWPLHCHVLYHLEAGMMTVLRYKDFIQSLDTKLIED